MAIKLLESDARPGMREIGQIRLGRTVVGQSGKKHPEKLDHFEILRRNAQGEWERDSEMHAKVGERPRSLDVYLASDDPDQTFHSELALYRGRGRCCFGDGERAQTVLWPGDVAGLKDGQLSVWRKGAGDGYEFEVARDAGMVTAEHLDGLCENKGESKKQPGMTTWAATKVVRLDGVGCNCPLLDREVDARKRCKPHLILRVMLAVSGKFGGYWVLRSTSWNTARYLTSSLKAIREQFGFLWGLKLTLVCSPQSITDTTSGKKQRVFVAHLEMPLDANKSLLAQARGFAEERRSIEGLKRALPAGKAATFLEDKENEREIVEEFHPEAPAEIVDAETGEVTEEAPPPDGDGEPIQEEHPPEAEQPTDEPAPERQPGEDDDKFLF